MAKVCLIYVGLAAALALCKYSQAEWNVTEGLANRTVSRCHRHGNGDNCTEDPLDQDSWHGHFSPCPKELTGYCVHGDCRYLQVQKVPSCRCEPGYDGARCEYLQLPLPVWITGEKLYIIIFCVIAGLVLIILLLLFICICSNRRCRARWRRRRRREALADGPEKLSMVDKDGTASSAMPPELTEPQHVNAV